MHKTALPDHAVNFHVMSPNIPFEILYQVIPYLFDQPDTLDSYLTYLSIPSVTIGGERVSRWYHLHGSTYITYRNHDYRNWNPLRHSSVVLYRFCSGIIYRNHSDLLQRSYRDENGVTKGVWIPPSVVDKMMEVEWEQLEIRDTY